LDPYLGCASGEVRNVPLRLRLSASPRGLEGKTDRYRALAASLQGEEGKEIDLKAWSIEIGASPVGLRSSASGE
jgi:hypothetical protein